MSKKEALVTIGPELKEKALAYPTAAHQLVVTNDKELKAVDEFVKGGKALIGEIRAGYDDIISDWDKGHKNAIAKRDHYLKPVAEGVNIAKGKMAPYLEEQARKIREAEERARRAQEEAEEAERKAEEERQRAAREAMHDGNQAEAEKILAKPIPEIVPETVVIPKAVELKGTHATRRWAYEVTNIDLVPRPLLMLDKVAVNKIVQEKQVDARIPGIRVFQKTGVSSGG